MATNTKVITTKRVTANQISRLAKNPVIGRSPQIPVRYAFAKQTIG